MEGGVLVSFTQVSGGVNLFNLQGSHCFLSCDEVHGLALLSWVSSCRRKKWKLFIVMEPLSLPKNNWSLKLLAEEEAFQGQQKKRQTNSNDQPPWGQGVVYRQAITGECGGRWRLPGKWNVLFQPCGSRNTGEIWESCWDPVRSYKMLLVGLFLYCNVIVFLFKYVT